MTQTTLRTVTHQTVENYRQVAEHAIGAYRASGLRLVTAMSRTFERSTARIAPRLAAALQQTNTKVSGVAARGIDTVSAQTERVIELGSARVSARIDRVADLVEGIENRYVATGLQTAARISLTGAQAALTLSEKLAAGADKLAEVVGGKHARGTRAVARAKTAVKAARRATAPAAPKAARRAAAPIAPTLLKAAKATKAVVKRVKAAPAKRAVPPVVKARAPRRAAPKVEQPAAEA